MISLVLIGLRLEQQFGYGMHSCRNLTPPGLSRTMSDLDLHSRFLTVRIGIPCFWRWRQRALISVHQEHHLCRRFWSSVRTPWGHAVGALHQLDHLLKQGADLPSSHCGANLSAENVVSGLNCTSSPYNSLLALVSGLSDVKLSEDDIGDGDDI